MAGNGGIKRSSAQRFVGSRGWALADPDDRANRIVARSRTAYIGHVAERETCRRLAHEAAAGHPRILVVTGETGIGKSRLLEEVEGETSHRGLRTVSMCCYSSSVDDFSPLRPLGRRLGTGSDLLIGADTLAAQAVALAHTIIAEARHEPLAFTVDDLDDADAGTLLVLRYLMRWCAQHSISGGVPLLVAVALRDLAALGPEPLTLADDDGVEVVELSPLSPLESLELVRELALGDVPRVVAEAVAERCEGNPLVARVITDILLAENRVGPGAVDAQLVGSDTMVWRLPRSPVGAIERQFESLDARTRRVLASAAALNGDGPVGWVSELAAEDGDAVRASLDAAGAAGIATVEDEVRFTHPLCRERALAELSVAELSALHARIAQALLDAGVDTSPALVEHLRAAGSAVDPALVHEKAASAGRAAAERRQWSVAARCLQLAATVGRRLPDLPTSGLAALCHETGDALWATGEVHEAQRWIARAADLFETAGDRVGWASSVVAALRCDVWAGVFGDEIDPGPLDEIAGDDDLPAGVRAEARLVASEIAWTRGDADGAVERSSSAIELAQAADDATGCAQALVSRATGHWLRLDLPNARDDVDAAATWAERGADPATVALVQGRRALTAWWTGELRAAEEAVARALDAASEANTPLERAIPLAAHAAIAALRADHVTTMRTTAEVDLLSSLSGDYWGAAFTFPTAAASSLWHGDVDDARSQLDRWDASLDAPGADSRQVVRLLVEACRRYVAVAGGATDERAWFAAMAPAPLLGRYDAANVGSATFFALLAEAAARLDLPDLAAAVLPYLDDAIGRGQVTTTGWPALLPRVAATACRVVGDRDGAATRARTAKRLADDHGLVVEQVRARLELAAVEGDDRHRDEATQLARDHGLVGVR